MNPISSSFTRRDTFRLAAALSAVTGLKGQGPAATDQPVEIRCGELTFTFVPQLGFVRHIRWNGVEILTGMYAAVRDSVWGTVPARISNVIVQTEAEEFKIVFEANCQQGDIDFQWNGSITGAPQSLIFSMDGVAKSTFKKNRIGFCVLHPIAGCAGKPVKIVEAGKYAEKEGKFPDLIAPHQPFVNMAGVKHEFYPGFWAELEFVGDTFEMEDHRNWTDGNFKTYCTPLSKPFPVEVKEGEKIGQAVVLKLRGKPNPLPQRWKETYEVRVQTAAGAVETPLPAIGFGYAPGKLPAGLRPAHIRLDLRVRGLANLELPAGIPLEAAVQLESGAGSADEQLAAIAKTVASRGWKVARWMVFHADEQVTDAKWIALARKYLKGAPIGGGTDQYFTELNRGRPAAASCDFASYSLNPQVHAFDSESLMENLAPQGDTVRTARSFWQKPLAISPVTLKPRFNPQAKVRTPIAPDPRQNSLFAAAWTAGSLARLLPSGLASVTYYETHGPAGVAGFPMQQAFAALTGYTNAVRLDVSDPASIAAVMLRKAGGGTRLLMSNLTDEMQRVRLGSDLRATSWKSRILDEESLKAAVEKPDTFLADFDWELRGSRREFALLPYATIVLTSASSPTAG